jgi:hypothetical protein
MKEVAQLFGQLFTYRGTSFTLIVGPKPGLATFLTIFSSTHLVTLLVGLAVSALHRSHARAR